MSHHESEDRQNYRKTADERGARERRLAAADLYIEEARQTIQSRLGFSPEYVDLRDRPDQVLAFAILLALADLKGSPR